MSWLSLFDSRARSLITDVVAYGSAIFKQQGNIASMKDLLVVVEDSHEFHRFQLQAHPNHYAPWMSLPAASMLNRLPARIFFNTGVECKRGETYKYGVIRKEDFIDDCFSWKNLYAAGRTQKPFEILQESPESKDAILMNRIYALKLALLVNNMKSETDAQWRQLFKTIIGLSYNGDVRMWLAENPKKIQNMLSKQEEHFDNIYRPLLSTALSENTGLPRVFDGIIDPKLMLHKCRQIVLKNSSIQSIKGLFTARPSIACSYVFRKLKKRFGQ